MLSFLRTEKKAYKRLKQSLQNSLPLKHLGSHTGPSGQSSHIFVEIFVNGKKKIAKGEK